MKIHIFNPEHDIALAAGNIFWTAPHAGRQLRADLGWIPALWADDGDIVVVDDVNASESAARRCPLSNSNVHFVSLSKLAFLLRRICGCQDITSTGVTSVEFCPWGWDKAIVGQLRRSGIDESFLPDDIGLDVIRNLSDRSTSSQLLHSLRQNVTQTRGESLPVGSMEELLRYFHEWSKIVVKSPWSSSGRGVRYMFDENPNVLRWADKVLRTMGHVMVERYQNKILDFGMEFTAHSDGSIRYDGLSVFDTQNGAYTGNILATEDEKVAILERYVERQLLTEVQLFITEWIKQKINGCYVGPFGVDMMVVGEEDSVSGELKYYLHPCVEINLRRTMGHVALSISPKEEGLCKTMRVSYEGGSYHLRIANNHEILV